VHAKWQHRLNGLTGASGGASLYAYEYNYDRVGNRTSLVANGTPTYYTYNAANELLHEVTPGVETAYYSYDGRGNQTQRSVLGGETTYYSYNSRNLITRIDSTQEGFTPNTFGYNALGQRIRITDSTGTKGYVWDGLDILLEHDGAGTLIRRYTHGHTAIPGVGSLIAVEDAEGNAYFYHMDPLGGIHRLTDIAQAIAKLYEFGPFGRILQETGTAPNEFVFPATYMFLADCPGSALSAARLYASPNGRYSGRDAKSAAPLYTALAANPVSVADPSGLDMVRVDLRVTLCRCGETLQHVDIEEFTCRYQSETAYFGRNQGWKGPWPVVFAQANYGKGSKVMPLVKIGNAYVPLVWLLEVAEVEGSMIGKDWAEAAREKALWYAKRIEEFVGRDRARFGATTTTGDIVGDVKDLVGIHAARAEGRGLLPSPQEVVYGRLLEEGWDWAQSTYASTVYGAALAGMGSALGNVAKLAGAAFDLVVQAKSVVQQVATEQARRRATWADFKRLFSALDKQESRQTPKTKNLEAGHEGWECAEFSGRKKLIDT